MNLDEKVRNLLVKYLVQECRDFNGVFSFNKQSEFILGIVKVDDLPDIFGEEDKYWGGVEAQYRRELVEILSGYRQRHVDCLDRVELAKSAMIQLFEKHSFEVAERNNAYGEHRLKQRIIELETQIQYGKTLDKVTLFDRLTSGVNLPYSLAVLLVALIVIGLSVVSLSTTMTVNVDFNIGDIIGGVLVGTGVAAAGVSYAKKSAAEDKQDKPESRR